MKCSIERKRQLENDDDENNNNNTPDPKKSCLEQKDVLDSLLYVIFIEILKYLPPYELCNAMTLNKKWKEECIKDIYWIDHVKRACKFSCTSPENWLIQKDNNLKVITPVPTLLKLEDWNPVKSQQFDSPVFSMFRQYKGVIMSSKTRMIVLLLKSNVTYCPMDITKADEYHHYWTYEQTDLNINSILYESGRHTHLNRNPELYESDYCLHNSPFYSKDAVRLHLMEWRAHFHCYTKDDESHKCVASCRGDMRPCTSSIGSITRHHSGGWRVSYQKSVFIEKSFNVARSIIYAMRTCMNRKHSFDYTSCIPIDHPCAKEYIHYAEMYTGPKNIIQSNTSENRPWVCGYCNAHHGPGVRIVHIKKYSSNCIYCNIHQIDLSHPMSTPFFIACFICIEKVIKKYKLNRKDHVCNDCKLLPTVEWV